MLARLKPLDGTSMTKLRICFTHYRIGDRDGVNAIIFRNIAGLELIHPEWVFSLAGKLSSNIREFEYTYHERFAHIDIPEFSPDSWDKKVPEGTADDYIFAGEELCEKMKTEFADFDVIIAENLQVGNYPPLSYGYYLYVKWCWKHEPRKRFIFRAHDFYKDRPENFINIEKLNAAVYPAVPDWHSVLFPNIPNVYFAAINRTSLNFIYEQGIPEERLFYLPNCLDSTIHPGDGMSPGFRKVLRDRWGLDEHTKILFSPIRCTPRKNIEESLLLLKVLNRLGESSIDAPADLVHSMKFHLILSMNISSGKAASYSRAIDEYVNRNNLPAHIGFRGLIDLERRYDDDGNIRTYSLSDAYAACRAVLTTSILEGFGFVFLEPWTAGKFLIGRNINDVTYDFKTYAGLAFDTLYNKLTVDRIDFPLIGLPNVYAKNRGNILIPEQIETKLEIVSRIDDDNFFGTFIRENHDALKSIVAALTDPDSQDEDIANNSNNIKKYFSQDVISQRLSEIILKAVENT